MVSEARDSVDFTYYNQLAEEILEELKNEVQVEFQRPIITGILDL